jgi:hypothetical protein
LLEEILPEVAKKVNLPKDGISRAIAGSALALFVLSPRPGNGLKSLAACSHH